MNEPVEALALVAQGPGLSGSVEQVRVDPPGPGEVPVRMLATPAQSCPSTYGWSYQTHWGRRRPGRHMHHRMRRDEGAGAVINTDALGTGDRVAVFGGGGIGLSVIQGARMAGRR